ncbi:Hypothetical protein TPAR_09546 [Tolypocladium paradoxum]|uniref:Uncharacterized protein n=1 Tax=Tolypocladium paradoxum TaxID=94208 RepID=A0A2S4KPT8_9HYPO|nr:Hypothetical protein TPAR_09546 [Tolypocladium paradoxum]
MQPKFIALASVALSASHIQATLEPKAVVSPSSTLPTSRAMLTDLLKDVKSSTQITITGAPSLAMYAFLRLPG